jgi:alpha-galactosidase
MTCMPSLLVLHPPLLLLFVSLLSPASATNNGFPNSLGLTPPRGVRTWNSVRSLINQTFLQSQVDGLFAATSNAPSLFSAGYTDVGIDDAWEACGAGVNGSYHDAAGEPLVDLDRFPDLRSLTGYARSAGATMSWYGNACGCVEGEKALSEAHYEQDARAAVAYGFAGIKIDGCGNEPNMTAWAAALNATALPDSARELQQREPLQARAAAGRLRRLPVQCVPYLNRRRS